MAATQGGRAGRREGPVAGLALHWEGLRLLGRERSLWKLAAVPFLLALLACGLTLALLVAYAGAVHGLATAWLPVLEAGAWYTWLWVGPAKLVLDLVGLVLFVAVAALALVLAFLVATVLSSPFLEALSKRVEALVTGGVDEWGEPGLMGVLREGGRAVTEEMRRLFFFLLIQAVIAFLGIVVPGGQAVAPLAMVAVTILFLPLDYASYTLDRRRLRFRDKRRWVAAHRMAMLGFGVGAFATLAVPGVNFLALPVLVVSGTLLVLRHPPAPAAS